MKHQSYLNRALQSRDRRFARVFDRMGYDVAALQTDIPADWQELSWPDLRALAASLTDKPVKSKADAIAAVEAEAARRTGGN